MVATSDVSTPLHYEQVSSPDFTAKFNNAMATYNEKDSGRASSVIITSAQADIEATLKKEAVMADTLTTTEKVANMRPTVDVTKLNIKNEQDAALHHAIAHARGVKITNRVTEARVRTAHAELPRPRGIHVATRLEHHTPSIRTHHPVQTAHLSPKHGGVPMPQPKPTQLAELQKPKQLAKPRKPGFFEVLFKEGPVMAFAMLSRSELA